MLLTSALAGCVSEERDNPLDIHNPNTRGAPTNLQAQATGIGEITLTWDDIPKPKVGGYKVYRSISLDGDYSEIANSSSSYVDIRLSPGIEYYYKVSALLSQGESNLSEAVSARTFDKPTGLFAIGGDRRVDLTWNDVGFDNLASYKVFRSMTEGSGYTQVATSSGNFFTDKELTNGLRYYYRISASATTGAESNMSDEVWAVAHLPDLAWSTGKSLSSGRSNLAVGVVEGKIYVIGGFNGVGGLATVEEYDPQTDTWVGRASMSEPRYSLAAGAVGGRIYAIGGFSEDKFEQTGLVEEYNPKTNKWTRKRDLSTPREGLAVGVADGKIYAIGGFNSLEGGHLKVVEEYNPQTDTWTRRSDMPTARSYLAVGTARGKIYAIGGFSGDAVVSAVEEYDPKSGIWTVKSPMTTSRGALGVGVIGNKLYAIGGTDQQGTVEEYDPETDTWTSKTPLLKARTGLAVGVVDTKIYAIGGSEKIFSKPFSEVEVGEMK